MMEKVKPLVQRRMSDGVIWIDGKQFSGEQALRIAHDILELTPASAEAATPARMFSIQDGPDIPWSVIAPFDKQCQRNHGGQTLEDLHRRGGLGVSEALAVLHAEDYDKRYPMNKPYPSEETLILELVALVKERQASAEAAPVERPEDK